MPFQCCELFKAIGLKRVKQVMVAPPGVPEHSQIAKSGPVIVEVKLVTHERELVIDPLGTSIQALTFEGSVPGPLIVVHENDYVELTLVNPSESIMSHNIDLHAVTGALGGAGLTLVNPGEKATIRFKATKVGVFVYHCAPGGPMIPYHVVQGMNGAIMVLPRDGLKDGNGNSLLVPLGFSTGLYIPRRPSEPFSEVPRLSMSHTSSKCAMWPKSHRMGLMTGSCWRRRSSSDTELRRLTVRARASSRRCRISTASRRRPM